MEVDLRQQRVCQTAEKFSLAYRPEFSRFGPKKIGIVDIPRLKESITK